MKFFFAVLCICLLAIAALADPLGPLGGQRASQKSHRNLQTTEQEAPKMESSGQNASKRFDLYGKMTDEQLNKLSEYANSPSFKELASNAFNMYDANADGHMDVSEVPLCTRLPAISIFV